MEAYRLSRSLKSALDGIMAPFVPDKTWHALFANPVLGFNSKNYLR